MKKAFLVSVSLLITIALSWVCGRPAYRHYRESRAVGSATNYLAQRDYANASICARRAIQFNSNNLVACTVLAELAERSLNPDALEWRGRIANLSPTVDHKLQFAATAMHLEAPPCALASHSLDELAGPANNSPAYHVISAQLALKRQEPESAAAHFEIASRLEPTNELHQLNLAVLRLQSTNPQAATLARATLDRLRTNALLSQVALRWLEADCLRTGDLAAARRFSEELLAGPRSVFEDRCQHMTILDALNDPNVESYLTSVQGAVATNWLQIYGTSAWMISHHRDALGWLTNLPAATRAQHPVQLALVDAYSAQKDWVGLESFLQEKKWSDLEFLRLGFLSHAAFQQQQQLVAELRWRGAVREAGDNFGRLMSLLGLAASAQRREAREDLLWQIGERFPHQGWAFKELNTLYLSTGNTHGLNRLSNAVLAHSPSDRAARNDFATTSFLLKLNLPQAHEMAKELYGQHTADPIVVSTYALSLHLQGRTREGVTLFEKLDPATLDRSPSVAFYYGVLLAAAGDPQQAKKYLELGQTAALLPEEKTLLREALGRL